MDDKERFERGLKIRSEVMGPARIEASLGRATDFDREFQEHFITGLGWGEIWSRPGLSRQQRSLLNIGMLSALQRIPELKGHIRGAIRNGMTVTEIQEALIQVAGYCGMPAGITAFNAARETLEEMEKNGELKKAG